MSLTAEQQTKLEHAQKIVGRTFENGFSFAHVDSGNFTVFVSIDVVFHLHGFKDNDGLSFLHRIADIHFNVEDNTRKRRFNTRFSGGRSSRFNNCRGRSSRCCSYRADYRFYNGFRSLFHFNFVRSAIYFNMGDIVFYISNGYLIYITIDFIFIFFHRLIFLFGDLLFVGSFAQGVNLRTPW